MVPVVEEPFKIVKVVKVVAVAPPIDCVVPLKFVLVPAV